MDPSKLQTAERDAAIMTNPTHSTKTQLVTLPAELLLEILELCMCTQPHRNFWLRRRTFTSISCVNKYIREACVPIMFKVMNLNKFEIQLHRCLQAIEGRPLLNVVRCFRLRTSRLSRSSCFGGGVMGQPCGSETPILLAKILCQMTNLQDLSLHFEHGDQSLVIPLRKQLNGNVMSPVQTLNFSTNLTINFVPALFPKLSALKIHVKASPSKTPGLAVIAPQLQEKLHTLHLVSHGWKREDIREIADLFPNIESLFVIGAVLDATVSSLLPIFKRFSNLKHLALANFQDLHSSGGLTQFCRRSLRIYLRDTSLCQQDAQADLANDIFCECPKLLDVLFHVPVVVGPNCYRPIRDRASGGVADVRVEEKAGFPKMSKF